MLLNRYYYVRNNPANLIDPLGLFDTRQFVGKTFDTGVSIVFETGIEMTKGAIKGGYHTLMDSKTKYWSEVIGGAEGGIITRTGGWNFVRNVGPNIVGDLISDKILHHYYSSGGETEVHDVQFLSAIPLLGDIFFSNILSAGGGAIIDEAGNVYDSEGNIIGNLQSTPPKNLNTGGEGGGK